MSQRSIGAVFAAAAAAVALGPAHARACGGFFCNAVSGAPVNQAAERIVFAKNEDGTITAVVQILYEGPSDRFAWVLPVPGAPEVEVSSDMALQRLQAATNPVYQMQTTVEGDCGGGGGSFGCSEDAAFTSPDLDLIGGEGGDSVEIVSQGQVGPYDYTTISLDPSLPNPGDVAVDWLQDNGYEVDDFGRDRLGPYLADGLNLIAFRLAKDRSSGSIRPVVLTFEDDEPMIPIRPTAVAAADDMGVLVWVLGEDRAVPVNYASLELNEALLDWFDPASGYDALVTAAADEAGGRGFVTELAGPTADLGEVVLTAGEEGAWAAVAQLADTDTDGRLIIEAIRTLSGWDGLRDVAARHVPLPEGRDLDGLLDCPSCVYTSQADDIEGFAAQDFVEALEAEVVEPMRRTQRLLEAHPYVTRLYTTMSAHEMTEDPIFGFNGSLEGVSNVHTANRVVHCTQGAPPADAPWRVELESGDVVWGEGSSWPLATDAGTMPANRRVLALERTGMGSVIDDHEEAIGWALAEHNDQYAPATLAGGGCTTTTPLGKPVWALLALLVLVYLYRP
ncbi:MAG: DUF2330 domain-containing protein, partial [Myxococcota bacterium]